MYLKLYYENLNMDFEKEINDKLKAAMFAKDKVRIDTLRAIKSAILNFKTSGKNEELNQDAAMKILNHESKKRKDAINMYTDANRPELLEKEENELKIIQEFLPKQLGEDEVRTIISEIVSSSNATSMKDMGKVMGMTMKQLKGKADGGLINKIVKELLSGEN